ncbi:hypothetical protein JF540_01850 [Salipiger thiooxidans]|uniref:hypothetical protein n=1 Tax=Salipiger thiooxidans TaxID=282683 RepID=UPI001A90B1C6|nr:hypothetical protein [Salipiger thiooxidans]MBN8185422.1 hypothetical protein [Salipiger thiooxidans]
MGDVSGINTSLSGTARNERLLGNGPLTTGIDFLDEKAEAAPGTSGRETRYNRSLFAQARQDLTDRVSVSYGALYDHQWLEGADRSTFENDASDTDLSGHEVLNPYTSDTPSSFDNLDLRLVLRNVFERTRASRSSDGLDFTGTVVPLTEPGRTVLVTAKMRF